MGQAEWNFTDVQIAVDRPDILDMDIPENFWRPEMDGVENGPM
jgi:hypothetical protein